MWKQILSVYFMINVCTFIENIFTSVFSSICKRSEYRKSPKSIPPWFCQSEIFTLLLKWLHSLLSNFSKTILVLDHSTLFDESKFLRNTVFTTIIITTSSMFHCSTTSNIHCSHVMHLCRCCSASINPVKTYLFGSQIKCAMRCSSVTNMYSTGRSGLY